MEEIKPATETTTEVAPTIAPEEDLEAKLAKLEEEKENYRKAYLKESSKKREVADEGEEERLKRLVDERLAESRLADIAREQDDLLRRALKENKELKLAHLNKNGAPPAVIGAHSESTPVSDTLVTPEQMAYFKSQGKDDKWIQNYKQNLVKKR